MKKLREGPALPPASGQLMCIMPRNRNRRRAGPSIGSQAQPKRFTRVNGKRPELQVQVLEGQSLREREFRLKQAQQLAKIGYWERDLLSNRITWSEETCRIWGRTPGATLTQAQMQEWIHPDDRPLQRKAFETSVRGGRSYDLEYRILRPDGELRFVHVWDEISHDASGRPRRMFGIVQDITERKQAEEAVLESQKLLDLVLATLPVGVVVTGPAGNIVLANAASKRIWGERIVSGRERWAKSKGFWHDSGEKIAPSNWASVRALSKGETSLNELIDIETFDGRRKTIQNSAAPIRKAGLIVGAVIVNEDVSERVRAEEALQLSQAELARAARRTMLGELTASIAHEINQPLVGVVANANACLQWLAGARPNLAEARKAVRHIARDGKRAGDVIAHVRALLQNGQPVRKPLNINQLVRAAVSLVRPELRRKSIEVRMRLMPALPRLLADPVQVQQVLMNLILNAVDALGEVRARPRVLRIGTARPNAALVRVELRDNGIGASPAQAKRLFEPFFTTKNRGLGLGLAISRSIIEAHGGSLCGTLNRGHGMTFRFTLPHEGGAR